MIKIELLKIAKLQDDYYQSISPQVIGRLTNLQTSLQHIINPATANSSTPGFSQFGTVTKKILNHFLAKPVAGKKFNKHPYKKSVKYYAAKAGISGNKTITDVLDLVNELLNLTNGQLKQLLTGRATKLEKINKDLELKFRIAGKAERDIAALAFDYDLYREVNSGIKLFFRTKNFVNYCPYCNQEPAMYNGLPSGTTIRVHQLDHFFDKATHPLLSYSLFNLVPGDWTCNSINKGTKPFKTVSHLNPYVSGFDKAMVFEPDYDHLGAKMVEIKLVVDPAAPLKRRKQLLGSLLAFDPDSSEGNINVFGLYEKYNRSDIQLEAGQVVRKFLDNLNNKPSLHGFLAPLGLKDAFEQYKFWYEEEVRAPFESKRFSQQRYSKMFRDMHDFVLRKDAQPHNKKLREISTSYP